LPYAAVGLISIAANIILSRCCFACRETRWPVIFSVVAVAINIVLSLLWLPLLGGRGLLLANAVSQAFQTVALAVLVWRLMRGFDLVPLLQSFAKVGLASIGMIFALHYIGTLGPVHAVTLQARAWYLLGELVIGAFAFLAIALAVRAEELSLMISLVLQKFASNTPSAPENRGAPLA
jgi:putative peptidoglycan lipid II flippase